MIPEFTNISGAPWRVLPAGIHAATFSEIEEKFTYNEPRRELFGGLVAATLDLRYSGCKFVFLDGSFITEKPVPGDYDACWDSSGVDPQKLDPVFFDFTNKRLTQKLKYKGEFFPASAPNGNSSQTFLDFFQIEKFTGQPKGILSISILTDPTLMRRTAP